MVIRRIGVWSVARLYGALSAAGGLIVGVIIALVSLVGGASGAFSEVEAMSGPLSMMLGVGAIIFLPLGYGVLGICVGAIGAVLYNLFAGMFGGIQLEIEP